MLVADGGPCVFHARHVLAVLFAAIMLTSAFPSPVTAAELIPTPQGPPAPCPPPTPTTRFFNVTALPIPIIYNNWGDFDPYGMMFVETSARVTLLDDVAAELGKLTHNGQPLLAQTKAKLAAASAALQQTPPDIQSAVVALSEIGQGFLLDQSSVPPGIAIESPLRPIGLQQPLTIRAKIGECVQIQLTNLAHVPVSIHIHSAVAEPGQGTSLGLNSPDLTLPGATSITAVWIPDVDGMEGAHLIHSHADSRYQTRHGLFGALVVERPGTSWTTQKGLPSTSGQDAIITHPNKPDFREFVLYYHDEVQLYNTSTSSAADPPLMPLPVISIFQEYAPGSKAINYRSEPFMDRFMEDEEQHQRHDKSQAYGSYTYGDPGVFIPRSYVGDPTKFRLVNAGPGQHHVHHLHGGGDRWRTSPNAETGPYGTQFSDPDGLIKVNPVNRSASERVDIQNIGPGESFNAEIEGGAGGVQRAAGDFLYHCHIVEHYVAGMWSFWRVYNSRQDDLKPLDDRIAPAGAITSAGLLGNRYDGKWLNTSADVDDWIRAQLPPPGERRSHEDASVWDWTVNATSGLYVGEPNDTRVWANYASPAPGERPPLLFNATNGRLAWPHMQPHLGMRPPFAPGHGPAPYLGEQVTEHREDGLCVPKTDGSLWQRNYSIVAQSTRIHYNARESLADGMVFAHAEDAPHLNTPAGKNATSLVIRANQGDCVDVTFANNLSDDKSKVNMHIHLVQFDPQASDGVITGFSYEQSVKPVRTTGTKLTASASAGATTIHVETPSKIREGTWIAVGLLEKNVSIVRARTVHASGMVELDHALKFDHDATDWVGDEFVRYKWYPDVELGTVYWHDHVDGVKGWQRGLFATLIVEPAGSRWCDPRRTVVDETNTTQLADCEDVRDGHVVDIVNPSNVSSSYREVVLQFQDRACVSEGGCNAGETDPQFPTRFTDLATFNLRSANLRWRNFDRPFSNAADSADPDRPGAQGDPATAETALLRAYPGDDVRIRLVYTGQSDTTGVGTFVAPGHRFKFEHNLNNSSLTDAVPVAVSSQHNLRLDCGAGGCERQPGDYLYHMSGESHTDRGAWGIFRVHGGTQDDLLPLPSNVAWTTGSLDLPQGVTPKRFDLSAVTGPVRLNQRLGITETMSYFVHTMDEATVVPAQTATPVVLRVNESEWVEVRLTNKLSEDHVGLTPSLLLAKPNASYGIPVGTNVDTRVPPGETRTFLWKADKAVGVARLASFAEMSSEFQARNHPIEGLYGAIVVEPFGASISSNRSASADVTLADGTKWREHVLQYASDDEQFFSSTMDYFVEVRVDPTVNYRTEPLHARVGGIRNPLAEHYIGGMGIHSCQIDDEFCGGSARIDLRNPLAPAAYALVPPETPILDVTKGHGLIVRSVGGAGEQLAVHSIDGHWWATDPTIGNCAKNNSYQTTCKSNIVSAVTLGASSTSNAWIPSEFVGKGGEGDYLWGNHRDPFREAGQWGILRVCGPEIGGGLANGTFGCFLDRLAQVGGSAVGDAQRTFQDLQNQANENISAFQDQLRDGIQQAQNIDCAPGTTAPLNNVTMPPLAFLANAGGIGNPGFVPKCVALPSTAGVQFVHADFQAIGLDHDPGTIRDQAQGFLTRCFNSDLHRPGAMDRADELFVVNFRWDPILGKLFARPGIAPERDCTNAIDPAQSTATHKVVPYQCDIHPNMVGAIVVVTSGSTIGVNIANPPAGPPNYT